MPWVELEYSDGSRKSFFLRDPFAPPKFETIGVGPNWRGSPGSAPIVFGVQWNGYERKFRSRASAETFAKRQRKRRHATEIVTYTSGMHAVVIE